MIPLFDPQSNQEAHKKAYYDLPSIQAKLGITQTDVDNIYYNRQTDVPVFLCTAKIGGEDRNFFISNYAP